MSNTSHTRTRTRMRREESASSEIRLMSAECERVGGINLSQGVCNTEVPACVRRAARAAIDEGWNTYTRQEGVARLREAISRKLERYNNVRANPETEIVVSAGATGAFYCACLALLQPGDEVIVFEPYYGYHVETLASVGANGVPVPMAPPEWSFAIAAVEAAITPRTRGLLINTPANPSGKVFTRPELEALARLAERHDLIVFTDEIYEYFVYDGLTHVSPASMPGLAERTVTISGYSKTFSVTGWRIGYAACNSTWADAIGFYNDLIYVCAPAPLQIGVACGIEELPPGYYEDLRAEYDSKRSVMCNALQAAGLTPYVAHGAYYVLAAADHVQGRDSREKARRLLSESRVAAVPGTAFFSGGRGDSLLRFCFAKPDKELEEAGRRLVDAVAFR
ncbi:MAG: aminotransferase class I/II-fold pyridoxal phosphate-dependent enzyme [Acidobacteria bacterium]|nr:aminotransferase class I/II-fold pyridoxal phosphate-dependent enzyme [Acidobacteriota bacterium]MCA1649161.1 aminotransferase class I/II-fold pyridoxal phosphate-dependent enzyme [Acidobacteriota bacterium]